jgi:hypothetical protein
MIVYQLACPRDHFFEGWFASPEACERQAADGHLSCPTCASAEIRKLPAAPYVKGAARAETPVPAELRAKVIAALRRQLLDSTVDVGRQFAEIARRIHYREEEARNIRGQVTVEEALELHEEGVEAYAVPPEVLSPEEVH